MASPGDSTSRSDAGARRARAGLLATILLAHAALLALLLHPVPHRDPVLERVMTLVAMSAPVARPALPPPPSPPDPVRVEALAPEIASPASEAASATAIAAGLLSQGCSVETLVADALAADPAATIDAAALGPSTRAATGAVMLWNGAWARTDDPDDEARLARLRPIVAAAVARAPASCRAAAVAGPRLIPVHGDGAITLLAIGSGRWRWDDLAGRTQLATVAR